MSGSGPIYEYQRELTAKLDAALRERDEARAEVERLMPLVDAVRAARFLLGQLRDHVSDHACDELLSVLSDEPMDADGNLYRSHSEMAYQRGAEAMREAAASCVGSDIALLQTYRSMLEGRIRDLPLPEDK